MRAARVCALGMLAFALPVHAQGGLFGASPNRPATDDKTGTNPLNLQQQVDVSHVHAELDALYVDTTTYRHAVPFLHRRVRAAVGLPIAFSNLTGLTEGGFGDLEADVEWTPWLSAHGGLVASLRTTWDTATTDGIGLGAHTFAPSIQYVFQTSGRTLVAPFLALRLSGGGGDYAPTYRDTTTGLYAAWRVTPRLWLTATPRVVFDLEYDRTYGDVAGEAGWLLLDRLSTYVRPGIGFGRRGEKPYDWAVTFGFRVVP